MLQMIDDTHWRAVWVAVLGRTKCVFLSGKVAWHVGGASLAEEDLRPARSLIGVF